MLSRVTTVKHVDVQTGRQVRAGTPGSVTKRYRSRKWYGLVQGKKVPLSTNKSAALRLLSQLRDEAETGAAGAHRAMRSKALSEHLEDYEAQMRAGGKGKGGRPPTDAYVQNHMQQLRRVVRECGWQRPGDLEPGRARLQLAGRVKVEPRAAPPGEWFRLGEVREALGTNETTVLRLLRKHALPSSGKKPNKLYPRSALLFLLQRQAQRLSLSPQTAREVAGRLKSFGAWLAKRCGLPENALGGLEGRSRLETDHRHDRRALTPEEARALLEAARSSRRVLRGLTGEDRWALYLVALTTGLRAGELAALTPERARGAHIELPGRDAKNGKYALQPVPSGVRAALASWLARRPPGQPLWPGAWADAPVQVLLPDLQDAGVRYAIDGPEGPLYADFHALRHTFVASLDRAGVSLKQAMQLARHSSPVLTARIYGRPELAELAAAVESTEFAREFARKPKSGAEEGGARRSGKRKGPRGAKAAQVPGKQGRAAKGPRRKRS